jgi:hypothetical protein
MSGLLGLIGSVGASIIGNRGAKQRQRQADAQNIKFWQMQNKYNDPSQQMARLKKAGLNPALIYGSGATNTGVAGSIAPSKPAPYNIKDPTPSAINSMLAAAQINNVNSATELNKANAKEKNTLLTQKLQKLTLSNISQQITNSNLDQKQKAAIQLTLENALQSAIANKEAVSQNQLNQYLRSLGVNPKASTEISNLLQSGVMLIDDVVKDIKSAIPGLEQVETGFKATKSIFEAFNKKKKKK